MLKSLRRKAKQLGYKFVGIAVETTPDATAVSALAARD
jgi:hypothetical protein